jgi:hypothetical protein
MGQTVTAVVQARGIATEFANADFDDRRLSARLVRIVETLAEHPERSLPASFKSDDAGLEAAYRFFNNVAVDPDQILEPHVRATAERCERRDLLLAIHDTTTFGYRAGGKRQGLGPHGPSQQFFAHVSLAVSGDASHTPLGILAKRTYVRKGDGGDGTESLRWLEQATAVERLGVDPSRIVHIEDREGDDYAALSVHVMIGQRFVIRADDDRVLAKLEPNAPRTICEALEGASVQAMREVPISSRSKHGRNPEKRKRHPPRNARLASLHVAATQVRIKRPHHRHPSMPETCVLNVVHVWEPSPPDGETPVRWVLLTTEPIDAPEQILAIVDMYRARWRIEELFKALKTGCAFEQKQLESYEALTNALAIYLPIAWRLLLLRALARDDPDAPGDSFLEADEWDVLRASVKRPLSSQPTRRELLLAVAALGGHLKHNGDPGWQTLARGLEELLARVEGFRLHRKLRPARDQS